MAGRPFSLVAFRHTDPVSTSRSNWRSKNSGTVWNHQLGLWRVDSTC
jgi:hypothetical protein